ncbi:MAG: GAF domain-containing protein, partial [Nitrospinota bacterium]
MEYKIKNPIKFSDEDSIHSMMKFSIKEKEELFNGIINNAGAAVCLKDTEGRYIFVNKEFEKLLKVKLENLIGKTDSDIFPDKISEKLIANDKFVLDKGQVLEVEENVLIENNQHTFLSVKFPVSNSNDEVFGVAGISTDITLRKRTESLLSIQNHALEKLAQGYPLEKYMDILTLGYEEIFPGAKCSVLLLNPTYHTLHNCSGPNIPKEFKDAINGMNIGPEVGSCGTAAFKKEIVIVENISTDPLWARAGKFALSHGLESCWSCPIIDSDNEVLGTFAVYYDSPKKPEKEELDIIQSMAHLARVAIENKNKEKELKTIHLELEDRVEKRTSELKTANRLLESEISERRIAEKQIISLSKFPDENPNPCLRVNRAGILIYTNLPGSKLLKNWDYKIFELVPIPFRNVVKKVFSTQTNTEFEVEANEQVILFHAVYVPEMDYINLYGQDITERKSAEFLATEQNKILKSLAMGEQLSIILNSMAVMAESYLKGMLCSVLVLNPETQRMHYISAPNIPKGYVEELDGFEIGPVAEPCGTAAYNNKTIIAEDIETDVYWKDYKHIALRYGLNSCWATPIQGSRGEVLVTLAFFWKHPKKSDDKIRDFHQTMAHLAGLALEQKRTEKKLKDAVRSSEKANQAKSEFLARMSHELRTPMNAILGFTQLLQMDKQNPLADYQKANMERVSTAGKYLLELINETLDLAKVESGEMKLDIERLNIIPIVENALTISKPLTVPQNISLELNKNSLTEIMVEVDKLRFMQVLVNLISNAIKYNKPNGSVLVSIEKSDEENVRISVKDTGNGIPKNQRNKLFIPFERFDPNAQLIEGTGIGLAISKHFVEMLKGTIGYESVEGEGSTFFVCLPITNKNFFMSEKVKTMKAISKSDNREKSNYKILYIEDIPENIILIERIFEHRSNFEILSAANASEGIELAKSIVPDLILMDIQLPDMDGFLALKKLQEINETQNIPVIALTADAMTTDKKRGLEEGFKDYLTKPIDISQLLHKIDKILS